MTDDDPGAPDGDRDPPEVPFRFVLRLPAGEDLRRADDDGARDDDPVDEADDDRDGFADEHGPDEVDDQPDGDADDQPDDATVLTPAVAGRSRRRRRSGAQRALLVLNSLVVVGCLVAAGTLWWTYDRIREIPVVSLGESVSLGADELGDDAPRNFLIVGTDSAEGLDPDDPVSVGRPTDLRSDTIMVLRLDPASGVASLLSVPRDLYVPISTGGSAKINSAIQGGPGVLIDTIDEALGIPVDHFVQLDFAGFQDLVAAVDGVPVFFPEPVRDRSSALSIPEAGCVNLTPVQALAYVRSRAYEVQRDGRWRTDGTADLGRISRQQDFIQRALQRAIRRGARNPAVLQDLVQIGFDNVTLDDSLAVGDVLALGNRFRSFEPGDLQLRSLPVFDDTAQGQEILRLQEEPAQAVLEQFRNTDALGSLPLEVRNGTGEPGIAEQVAEELRAVGFVVPEGGVGDADTFDGSPTRIEYLPGAEAEVALLASHLGVDPEVGPSIFLADGARLSLRVGADWAGVLTEPRAQTPGLVPAPTTTAPTPTSTATTTEVDEDDGPAPTTGSTTSTTERVGEVPDAPAGSTC